MFVFIHFSEKLVGDPLATHLLPVQSHHSSVRSHKIMPGSKPSVRSILLLRLLCTICAVSFLSRVLRRFATLTNAQPCFGSETKEARTMLPVEFPKSTMTRSAALESTLSVILISPIDATSSSFL